MTETNKNVAASLLKSKAVILRPTEPFTWASGWLSPIYCDNRITLSYPDIRTYIRDAFTGLIREQFPGADLVAGVASGAIAQGALVADAMELPFVYVRPSAKGHGRQNLIEGRMSPGQKVVVVEDLISTGGSSLKAVESLREAGAEVLGMVAIFTYGFPLSVENFNKAGVKLHTLTDYHTLLKAGLETGDVKEEQVTILQQWRENPSSWKGI